MQPKITKEQAREDLKRHEQTVTVSTLEGEKEYSFILLKRKEAAEVFHNTLLVVASAFAELIKANETNPQDILKALNSLDFNTFWGLATKLLKGVVIDGNDIGELEETAYFEDKPEELYIAVGYAIKVNYPKVFTKIREKLSGSSLADKMKEAFDSTPNTV